MAFNARKIAPLDFKPSTGVGVDLPFSNRVAFKSTFTNREAIRNNLINWFLTNQGERPLNPEFGGNLRRFLFEQISNQTLDFIEDEIQSNLQLYFSNIIVESLDILSQPNSNSILIVFKYSISDTQERDEINITFAN